MKVTICEKESLCFVQVNPDEALALIESLSHQLLNKSPNGGRLESRCSGDVNELTIAVIST
jgi:hypothetical protein